MNRFDSHHSRRPCQWVESGWFIGVAYVVTLSIYAWRVLA